MCELEVDLLARVLTFMQRRSEVNSGDDDGARDGWQEELEEAGEGWGVEDDLGLDAADSATQGAELKTSKKHSNSQVISTKSGSYSILLFRSSL